MDNVLAKRLLKSKVEMNNRAFDSPTSVLQINNKRINYYNFIVNHENKDCDDATKRIAKKIDLTAINKLIDSIEIINDDDKTFLKKMIIDKAYFDLITK